jgi:hypothetical protein
MDEVLNEVLVEVPHTRTYTAFTVPPGNDEPPDQQDFTNLRIIFLDIDGCLNSTKTQVATGGISNPTRGADANGISKVEIIDLDKFDPITIDLINRLCEATNAVIVLSSSWRLGFNALEVRQMLKGIGIDPEYVLGKTASLDGIRGKEIHHFLKNLEESIEGRNHLVRNELILEEFSALEEVKVGSYVIIDDESDMLDTQLKNFVHVNGVEGFSLSDAIYAGRILTKSEDFGLKNFCNFPLM